jgi:hypothetical protein
MTLQLRLSEKKREKRFLKMGLTPLHFSGLFALLLFGSGMKTKNFGNLPLSVLF